MLQNQYGYTNFYHHWLNMDVQERKLLNIISFIIKCKCKKNDYALCCWTSLGKKIVTISLGKNISHEKLQPNLVWIY